MAYLYLQLQMNWEFEMRSMLKGVFAGFFIMGIAAPADARDVNIPVGDTYSFPYRQGIPADAPSWRSGIFGGILGSRRCDVDGTCGVAGGPGVRSPRPLSDD